MLNPSVNYVGPEGRVKFNGDCLKQGKVLFDHGKMVNIYFVHQTKFKQLCNAGKLFV